MDASTALTACATSPRSTGSAIGDGQSRGCRRRTASGRPGHAPRLEGRDVLAMGSTLRPAGCRTAQIAGCQPGHPDPRFPAARADRCPTRRCPTGPALKGRKARPTGRCPTGRCPIGSATEDRAGQPMGRRPRHGCNVRSRMVSCGKAAERAEVGHGVAHLRDPGTERPNEVAQRRQVLNPVVV